MKHDLVFNIQFRIIIYDIEGVELNITPETYGLIDHDDNPYHRIFGSFYYSDLLVQGQLILSEKSFNNIIKSLEIIIISVEESIIYFQSLDDEQMQKLRKLNLKAKCMGDEEFDSEFDENFTFHLINNL